jgi:hypothetical protein
VSNDGDQQQSTRSTRVYGRLNFRRVYTLEPDDEYSEISDFESTNHPSVGDESESAVTVQPAP